MPRRRHRMRTPFSVRAFSCLPCGRSPATNLESFEKGPDSVYDVISCLPDQSCPKRSSRGTRSAEVCICNNSLQNPISEMTTSSAQRPKTFQPSPRFSIGGETAQITVRWPCPFTRSCRYPSICRCRLQLRAMTGAHLGTVLDSDPLKPVRTCWSSAATIGATRSLCVRLINGSSRRRNLQRLFLSLASVHPASSPLWLKPSVRFHSAVLRGGIPPLELSSSRV